jgi:hypothetical protein
MGQFCQTTSDYAHGTCACLGSTLPPCGGVCCGLGQHCDNNICVPGCINDANCQSLFCVGGACVTCKPSGSGCGADGECCSGTFLTNPFTHARFCA